MEVQKSASAARGRQTTDQTVAVVYATCNGNGERGVLLEIWRCTWTPSTQGRMWELILSQYPHEKEILLPPLVFHEVESIKVAHASTPSLPVLHVKTRLRVPAAMLKPALLTTEEERALHKVLSALLQGSRVQNDGSKFMGDVKMLRSGQPAEAARGLAHFMKVGR